MRLLFALLCLMVTSTAVFAGNAVFTYVKTVPAADLNEILDKERSEFIASTPPGAGYEMPSVQPAANDIEIYRVRYESRVPEQGDRKVIGTGLLALPVLKDRSSLPLMSYQHGTVLGKYEVPSYAFLPGTPAGDAHHAASFEARYMAGLFAGGGYALIAADYFGMGDAAQDPEAFFVKASTQQAEYDLYRDAVQFMKSKGITVSDVFLGGWSLGGLNTTGFLEKLQDEGVEVTGSFTAAAPSDPFAALNGLLFHPRPGVDAVWVNTLVALSVFAFEKYLGPEDLARQTLDPAVYDDMRAIYERSYSGQSELVAILERLGARPLVAYLRPDLRDPVRFANSDYGRLLAAAETYRDTFTSPVRMYYGSGDEALRPLAAKIAAIYQSILIGNADDQSQNMVSAIEVKDGNHHATFVQAAALAKVWMDGLKK